MFHPQSCRLFKLCCSLAVPLLLVGCVAARPASQIGKHHDHTQHKEAASAAAEPTVSDYEARLERARLSAAKTLVAKGEDDDAMLLVGHWVEHPPKSKEAKRFLSKLLRSQGEGQEVERLVETEHGDAESDQLVEKSNSEQEVAVTAIEHVRIAERSPLKTSDRPPKKKTVVGPVVTASHRTVDDRESGGGESKEASANDASSKNTSAKDTSVKDTSATDSSAKDTSVKDTSATDSSAKDTSVKDSSAKETSAKKTGVKKTIADESSRRQGTTAKLTDKPPEAPLPTTLIDGFD